MTKLRKFFASSVMVMTVVVMSGLTAPITTNAAASAGDLIKKDGLSAVYYLGEDGKRYVFPNEATYKSWYSDFSGVVTISSDELASYPLGGNVVIRPGTKLVKITTDPKVYAVEANGTLRPISSEADAIALFGADWAKRVIDVADSFFTNYTIKTPLASNEVPAGSLVKKSGENNIYYFDGSNYRLIEDEVAFLANRFQHANILTLDNFTPGGSTITGSEASIVKTSQAGSTGGFQPGQGTGVTVALNSMTSASQSVPQTVGRIPFTKINLTASADGAAYVDAITITRTGLTSYASNNFKVWAEKDGVVVASKRALTTNDNVILNFSPVLNIPAGQTVTLDILADVTEVGGNGALGVASASAVSASGSTVSGSFPIVGNTMSFANYDVTTVTFSTSTVNSSVKIGDEEVELASFDVVTNVFGTDTTTGRDTILKSLTLRNGGAEDLTNVLMNVRLENNGEIVSNNATFNGRYVTFTFKNSGFEMLKEDGGSETFTIKADVIGKDSLSENSIELRLYKSEDFYAYEKATGFGVKVAGNINASFGSTKIESGIIDVSKKSTNPSDKDVIKGVKDEVVLLANIKADEAIKTEGIDVNYHGDKDSFQNVKVYLNNVLLSSFDLATSTATFEPIDSSLTLNKGNNEVKITVDVKTTASSTKTFKAWLYEDLFDSHNPEYVSSGNAVVYSGTGNDISGSAYGATLTVSGGALTFTRNDGYANGRKVSQGSNDVVLGRFAVKATNDAVRINSISLSAATSTGVGTTTDSAHIYDMKLFVDGSQIGTTRNFTTSGSTFSSLNYSISQNTTKIIELRGSLTSEAANTATTSFRTTMTVNAQDSLGKSIDAATQDTARFEITSSGKLTVAAGADTPGANILVAKAGVEQEIAQYTLTSEDDSSNVSEIVITNATTTSPRIGSYKLYLGSTLLDTAIPVEATTTFYITNNKLVVNANESKTISLKAVLNPIEVQADTNKTLVATIASVKAKSSAGEELSVSEGSLALSSAVSKTMTILKTKPTFAHVSNAIGGAGLNQELLRFSVTADANEDLNITKLVFDLYGTGAATATGFKIQEIGGDAINADAETATTTSFTIINLIVGKGATKTFRVTGNTSLLTGDATFGIALDNAVVDNISWGEKFVSDYTAIDGANLGNFPIDGGTTKY